MNKAELASYLVSLHTLLYEQTKGQHSIPSATLVEEYEKHWGLLKDTIHKENDNETRQTKLQWPSRSEGGTDLKGSEPGSGGESWEGNRYNTDVPGSRIPSPDAG